MVQDQCTWINKNAQLDDNRAKCGEIHQMFRTKDLLEEQRNGDQRALETIEGLPHRPDTGLMQSTRYLVLEEEASDLLSGHEVMVMVFNDLVLVADTRKEFFSGRKYLKFRDKVNLDSAVLPDVHNLRESDVDMTGRAQYHDGPKDVTWQLRFERGHQRDGFVKAIKENAKPARPPPPASF